MDTELEWFKCGTEWVLFRCYKNIIGHADVDIPIYRLRVKHYK